jgi:hypothetical protein
LKRGFRRRGKNSIAKGEGDKMLIPVMQYIQPPYDILLVTDEARVEWFVMVGREGEGAVKAIRCVGCHHGLDVFDMAVNHIRNLRLLN